SAAGTEPPITNPKYRPLAIATRPGSQADASSSTTRAGSLGPSGSGTSRRARSSSCVARGKTGRSSSESRKSPARAAVRCRGSRVSVIDSTVRGRAWARQLGGAIIKPMRRTRTAIVIWTMFAVVIAAIVVTYSRLAPEGLYNVTGHGFVHGGLSRALVYVNFP